MWSLKIVTGAELADKLQPEVRLPQPLQRFTIGRHHWLPTEIGVTGCAAR